MRAKYDRSSEVCSIVLKLFSVDDRDLGDVGVDDAADRGGGSSELVECVDWRVGMPMMDDLRMMDASVVT